jgi:alpha-beta hydrolase superfamily lysophospholipase
VAGSRAFTRKEVVFPDGPTLLEGAVFLPDRKAPCPAIVLLGGAERGPRGPYKHRMASHFAEHGIAALTYDSPGTGQSTGNTLFQTKRDRVREAVAAHRFLREQEGILSEQVGIWGISEGAGIALLAAAAEQEVAFVMPISGALGVAPVDQIRYRIEMMGLERNLRPEEIQKALVLGEIQFALLAGVEIVEWPLVHMKVGQWPEEPWDELINLTMRCRQKLTDEEKSEVKEELRQVTDTFKAESWFEVAVIDPRRYQQFVAMDTSLFFNYLEKGPFASGDWNHNRWEHRAFAKIQCPVLAIWGERDHYVPSHRSAAGFRDCMSDANNEDVTITIVPGASHLITVPGSRFEIAGEYPEIMSDWLVARFDVPEGM